MTAAPTLALLEVLLPMARADHTRTGLTHTDWPLPWVGAGPPAPWPASPRACCASTGFRHRTASLPMGGLARLSCFPVSQPLLHQAQQSYSLVVLARVNPPLPAFPELTHMVWVGHFRSPLSQNQFGVMRRASGDF